MFRFSPGRLNKYLMLNPSRAAILRITPNIMRRSIMVVPSWRGLNTALLKYFVGNRNAIPRTTKRKKAR